MELTHERAWRLFCYDPDTGVLSWRERRGNVAAGTVVNCVDSRGHLRVRVDKKHYAVHRVVWLMVFGEWPREQIDHIDFDKKNNCIGNLRDVSNQINNQNRPVLQRNNTSGYTGVTWDAPRGKWAVQITVDGVDKHMGRYDSIEEAAAVRANATRQMHIGFVER